ncbi:MAG TPA: PAS domain S-box protein [Candidatus Thermoplasmatota archaeon]|nr:PAS domain S-box protein [Candidatus Thermoplasmatota archaeon]
MGDARYQPHLDRILNASDRAAEIARLEDAAVVQALAAASSREPRDPYLANVLATEAMNRIHRATLMARHMWEGVVTTDEQGRVQSVNPAAARILGRSEPQMRGQRVGDLLCRPPAGCPALEAIRRRRPLVRKPQVFRRADGSTFLASVTAAPVLHEGVAEGAVVVFDDVTAEKEAQAARDRALAKFRALFHSNRDALVLADPARRILDVNPAFTRLVGYAPEEVRGRTARAFFADDAGYGRMGAAVREAARRGATGAAVLARWRRRDGSTFLAEVLPSIVRDEAGALIGYLGTVRDASGHGKGGLPGADALLAALARHAPGAVAVLDADLRFAHVGDAFARALGWSADALAGARLDAACPGAAPLVDGLLQEARAGRADERTWRLAGEGWSLDLRPVFTAGRFAGAVALAAGS